MLRDKLQPIIYLCLLEPDSGAEGLIYDAVDYYIPRIKPVEIVKKEIKALNLKTKVVNCIEEVEDDKPLAIEYSDDLDFSKLAKRTAYTLVILPKGILPEPVERRLMFIADGVIVFEVGRHADSVLPFYYIPKAIGGKTFRNYTKFHYDKGRVTIDLSTEIA